jgi:hypothetical protein
VGHFSQKKKQLENAKLLPGFSHPANQLNYLQNQLHFQANKTKKIPVISLLVFTLIQHQILD